MIIYIAKKRACKTYHQTLESAQAQFTRADGWELKGGGNNGVYSNLIYLRPNEYGEIKSVRVEE